MTHYLRLKFEDAALVLKNKANPPSKKGYTHIVNELGVYSPSEKAREIDYDMPIGVSQVSNMLHVMFGYAPKPTYRRSIIKRNEEIYNIAKNARIRYYDDCDKDLYDKSEVMQGAKAPFNSHMSPITKIGEEKYDGFYNWAYFLKRFDRFDDKYLVAILSFFNKIIGCDDVLTKYNFDEFVLEFEKYTDTEEVKNFIISNPIYFKRGGILLSAMTYVIFKWTVDVKSDGKVELIKKKPLGNNTSYQGPTPLLENKEASKRKAKLSGEIIVEFDNDELVERLHRYGTLPTLLDGGLVNVVSLENELPFTETIYKLLYKEISEQKGVEVTE